MKPSMSSLVSSSLFVILGLLQVVGASMVLRSYPYPLTSAWVTLAAGVVVAAIGVIQFVTEWRKRQQQ